MSTVENENTFSWALHKNGHVNSQTHSKVNAHTGNVLKDLSHYNKKRKNFLRFKLLPLTKSPFLQATMYFLNSNSNQQGCHYSVLTKANACTTLCITYSFFLTAENCNKPSRTSNFLFPFPNDEFIKRLIGNSSF